LTLYTLLKFVHVALAIVAIGFNLSYAIWLRGPANEPAHAAHVLRGIKTLDDRFATPAYVLLLVTGFALIFEAGIPVTTFWILSALVLYVGIVVGGFIFYTPTLRGQRLWPREANPTRKSIAGSPSEASRSAEC
jgi:uncharacterized membrane protein